MNTTLEHKSQTANQRAQQHENQSAKAYPSRTIVHAKLEMTEPGDHDEREADAIANTVMSGGKIARKISSGGSGSSGIAVSSQMESQLNHLQGGGQAMPEGLRSMMESGFGQDFRQVRLHTDSEAANMSNSIHAKAFTHGNDIYFNQGKFNPNSEEGQRLVAHELVHVAQGKAFVRRKKENDKLTSSFPSYVGDFSEESKEQLDKVITLFKEEIKKFEKFAKGQIKNIDEFDIPDITPLLKKSSNYLLSKNKNYWRSTDHRWFSRLKSTDKSYRIDITHPEVRKYLMKSITAEEANLFYLWIRYSPDRRTYKQKTDKSDKNKYYYNYFALFTALGFTGLNNKDMDYVKHRYSLDFSISAQGGKRIQSPKKGLGLGGAVNDYVISYENDYGLEWSINLCGVGGSLSVGFSVGSSFAVNGGDSKIKADRTDVWFSPKDLKRAWANGLEATASGNFRFFGLECSGSFLNFDVPGKGTLSFDTSGKRASTGFNPSFDIHYGQTHTKILDVFGLDVKKADPVYQTEVKKTYTQETEDYIVDRDIITFETGSDIIESQTYGEKNKATLDRLVEKLFNSYRESINAGTFRGVSIKIVGHASPMWKYSMRKYGDDGTNNLVLSADRALRTQEVLEQLIETKQENPLKSFRFFNHSLQIPLFSLYNFTDKIESDCMGDEEGLRETGDKNNNDEQFRKAEITITFKLSRVTDGLHKIK